MSRRTKLLTAAVVGALLLGGVTTGLVAQAREDRAAEAAQAVADRKAQEALELQQAAADAEAEAESAAREAAAEKAADKQAADKFERSLRRSLVRQMQRSITKDAKESVDLGVLEGPIYYTSCDPLGGGSTDDLTALTTTFDCIVVNEKLGDGTARGYGYAATMNWDETSWTWQLDY